MDMSQRSATISRYPDTSAPVCTSGAEVCNFQIADFPILDILQQDRILNPTAVNARLFAPAIHIDDDRPCLRTGAFEFEPACIIRAGFEQYFITGGKNMGVYSSKSLPRPVGAIA